ncbi:HMA domain-containing protein [Plasmodiophora brassicae]|uniref:HMA domain-containing protein n=1 Tax=Plasmodiophora brassicae TaxID=37360 RepID=A0A0G4IQV0_PLABS|nr:hypothetical protein PBRA_000890 [Plasmodiophora brassicae]SPQ97849.1 unnamed protein product [Plasmodiophora brassicae]
MEKEIRFRVGMTCGGCKNAVTRIMSKTDGVTSFDVDVDQKLLVVRGTASQKDIYDKLSKWAATTGKEVTFLSEQ